MSNHTGITRSAIHRDHALITPESHVPIVFPQWPGCESVVLISPEMGAKFSQMLVKCNAGASMTPLSSADEVFILVQSGAVVVECEGKNTAAQADDFFFLPADTPWKLTSDSATLLLFSKPFVSCDLPQPGMLHRSLKDVPAEPFLGDPGALLQVLLPDDPAYDWGINLFEFVPGGTLPQVECHFMEHGLLLLAGQGVYRLGDRWYPVTAGDAIWMGPYLLQWYAATGKENSRYIYYKEMNRPPVPARQP
ncbi:MAG: (S)-ureidoglycine aminohydrolase [Pseudomonadota bacterium]